jgi:hypothetical protein
MDQIPPDPEAPIFSHISEKHVKKESLSITLNLTLSAFFFILTLLASFLRAFSRKSLISLISRGIFYYETRKN